MSDGIQDVISELSPQDLRDLSDRLLSIQRLLQARYGDVVLSRRKADLPWLQRLIDDRAIAPNQVNELQSLGIAFGEVLAQELGLRWVVVQDRYGRDPALRLGDTSLLLFPRTILSRRIAAGQAPDVASLLESIRAHLQQLASGEA
jgi:hypothetical protein